MHYIRRLIPLLTLLILAPATAPASAQEGVIVGTPFAGVTGTLEQFGTSATFGYLRERIEAVRRACFPGG